MKAKAVILSLVLIFSGVQIFAQLSKQERKLWKSKAKEYGRNPAILKKLVEDQNLCLDELDSLSELVSIVNSEREEKNARITNLDGQVTLMRQQLASVNAELAQARANPPTNVTTTTSNNTYQEFNEGVIFRVQIGAFTNKDLSKYFTNNPNFFGEAVASGEQKATIGVFRDYEEADLFKKYMRQMGVRDAWIVPYRDGIRVPLRDVLAQVRDNQTSP